MGVRAAGAPFIGNTPATAAVGSSPDHVQPRRNRRGLHQIAIKEEVLRESVVIDHAERKRAAPTIQT